ncbi:MAG: polyprenyl synthetase family protein [Actinobacteria bacterium]|nr:MAG: polyprenyl synthetase family protein [Actinomycetota bacterium]
MSFSVYLERQSQVEQALKKLFACNNYPELIFEAMKYSLFSGGKRFRSVLNLFTYELFDKDYQKALPTACALECIHTYSLIHDDLPAIDNDELRRGQPSSHVKFGEDIAILAGDALFCEAFYIISSKQIADPMLIKRAMEELSFASGPRGMVGGQLIDIKSTGKSVDYETVDYIHSHKTGMLIEASAKTAAILAGASQEEIDIISLYAKYLGLAFQIKDDILDIVGKTEILGKEAGSDIENKKATYPSTIGLKESEQKANEAREKAKNEISKLKRKTSNLIKLADYVVDRKS